MSNLSDNPKTLRDMFKDMVQDPTIKVPTLVGEPLKRKILEDIRQREISRYDNVVALSNTARSAMEDVNMSFFYQEKERELQDRLRALRDRALGECTQSVPKPEPKNEKVIVMEEYLERRRQKALWE